MDPLWRPWFGQTLGKAVTALGGPGPVTYASFDGKLYVFHQGQGEGKVFEGWLWMNVFDGAKWAGDTKVLDTGMYASPSAVEFNGKLYVFHQGQSLGDRFLWKNEFNGKNWAGDTQVVPNTGMSKSPSAVTFNNKLYVFHNSQDPGWLYMNVFDGTKWDGDTAVLNTAWDA